LTSSDRRAAIIRLLETRDDNLPLPSARTVGVAGFVHDKRSRSCPDCLANGRVMFDCETCGGSGVVDGSRFDRVSAADELPDDGDRRDPYSVNEKTTRYGLDGSRHDTAHARDRQIEMLARQIRPALSEAALLEEANREPYVWEIARARMFRLYDYRALNTALAWLRNRFPAAPAMSNFTLAYLDVVLPDPLRAPGAEAAVVNVAARGRHADRRALDQRDDKVRAAIDSGTPTAEVAALFRLSVSQVNRIVARGVAA